jgi:hypothetical protein
VVELRIINVEVGRNVWVWSVHRPSNTTIVGALTPAYVESGPVQEKREMQKVACRDRDHAARELDWI